MIKDKMWNWICRSLEISITCFPSRICGPAAWTVSTQAGSLNVTNPNPRDLPVAGFVTTTQSVTSPKRQKYAWRDSEEKLQNSSLRDGQFYLNSFKYRVKDIYIDFHVTMILERHFRMRYFSFINSQATKQPFWNLFTTLISINGR